MITALKCPACQQPLDYDRKEKYLFCGHGPCPSIAANEGVRLDVEADSMKSNDPDAVPDEAKQALEELKRNMAEEGTLDE